jgi:2-dehydro-3-deoxyglucarate aldolase/4-hydroxy-2-oxoheptanedioate aldolase
MDKSTRFAEKLANQDLAFGTVISFADPTVTELLAEDLDFVWIDMEHSPQTLQTVQAHVMATRGSGSTPLVRVPWNNHVLIKPVLDCGAAGIVVPMVRTADDAREAVAACLYPPEGIRGFGPRRPSKYGRLGGAEFCRKLNRDMICILQIEHADAIKNIDEIVAVPGVTSLVIGPNDLGGSLGHMGEPGHPQVLRAIDTVLASAGRRGLPVGIGIGADPQVVSEWIDKGMRWIALGSDSSLLLDALGRALQAARGAASKVQAK